MVVGLEEPRRALLNLGTVLHRQTTITRVADVITVFSKMACRKVHSYSTH